MCEYGGCLAGISASIRQAKWQSRLLQITLGATGMAMHPMLIAKKWNDSDLTKMDALQSIMVKEWQRVSLPEWKRILQDSIEKRDTERAKYAEWMLSKVLVDSEDCK